MATCFIALWVLMSFGLCILQTLVCHPRSLQLPTFKCISLFLSDAVTNQSPSRRFKTDRTGWVSESSALSLFCLT